MSRTIFTLGAALVVTTLVAGGTAVYALAGHGGGSVPSITGCLTGTGKLAKLKVGDVPKQPCGTQTQVHLSGGDITAALPGYGLDPRSGATQGPATLAVDPTVIQNRVEKDCGTDAAISRIHEDGLVDCDSDDGLRNYVRVTEQSSENSDDVKTLFVDCPAGTVVVSGGGDSLLQRAFLLSSLPSPPSSWIVQAKEQPSHNLPWRLFGYAMCADIDS